MDDLPTLQVEIVHAFGSHCGSSLRDAAFFGDEAGLYVVHPVGRHLAFRHLPRGLANYAIESQRVEAVTACAISRDRNLLAVGEHCSSAPFTQVSVYDMWADSTRPVQTLEELGGAVGRILCAAFSADSNSTYLCLTSCGGDHQDPLLVVLDWRRNEVFGRCSLLQPAERVAVAPIPEVTVSASGPDFLQLYVPEDGELYAQPEVSGLRDTVSTYVDHAWLEPGDGRLAVCKSDGSVLLLMAVGEDPRVLTTISSATGEPKVTLVPRCIRCWSGKIMIGGPSGMVALWEVGPISDDGECQSSITQVFSVQAGPSDTSVCCLDCVPGTTEEQILLGFEDTCIGLTTLAALSAADGSQVECNLVAGGFHAGPVSGLDVAAQRPVAASISRKDCSVRVWNFSSGRCDLCWKFTGEELTSVAIHPLGYLVAVSFADRVRLMQVLANELKPFHEFGVRWVRLIRFSHGGHLLAAVQGKLVLIFSTRTLAKVATLRGHSQQVTALSFDDEDRLLTTCGEDGCVCDWSTQSWNKVLDQGLQHTARAFEIHCVAAAGNGCSYAGVVDGGRTCLRSFRNSAHVEDEDIELPGTCQLTALCQRACTNGVCVLASTSAGTLWTCTSLPTLPRTQEFGLHMGLCNDVCIAADGCTVVTGGQDGAVFVLRVEGLSATTEPRADGEHVSRRAADPAAGLASVPDGEVVLVNRSELQARQEELQRLSAEAAALRTRMAEEAARLEGESPARVAEARKKDQEQIQALLMRYELLQQAATARERENLRLMKSMEASHLKTADKLERVYDKRLRQDADRLTSLERDLREVASRMRALREDCQLQLEQQRNRHQQELQSRLAAKDAEQKKLKDIIAFNQRRYDVILDQEGGENELELNELSTAGKEELEQQRLAELKLRKEQDTLLRSLEMMAKDRERASREQGEALAMVQSLTAEAEALQTAVAQFKAERREREAALRDKELEISAHKVQVATLKKFKNVLDYRLREVTLSLQPKDQMIQQLSAQLQELEAQFEQQLKVQKQMEAALAQKVQQISATNAESERLREGVRRRERAIARFNADLAALATGEQDLRRWPQGIRKIYQDHVDPARVRKDENSLPLQEMGRQIEVMERKVVSLGARGRHTENTFKADITQKAHENSLLIHEIEELRTEKEMLRRQAKDLEIRVRLAEHKLSEEAASTSPKLALMASTSGSFSASDMHEKSSRLCSVGDDVEDKVANQRLGTSSHLVKLLKDHDVRAQQVATAVLESLATSGADARGADAPGAAARVAGGATRKPRTAPGVDRAQAKAH